LIGHGESVGIIGANGAGKSTLLMLLTGVFFAKEGEISVGDVLLNKSTLNSVRQRVGFCFQNPDEQLFMPTVFEDVAFGPMNLKLSQNEVFNRVEDALSKVDLLHLKDKATFKLSGGEKRRAAIAGVLAMQPDILIMDEPSDFLDPKQRRNLINTLKTFTHTKIITSHDLDLILELCERTIVLKDGKIIADKKTADIVSDKDLMEKAGLEIPLSMQGCKRCSGGVI
jgi:cobalt/nickel transport system ATP-binding protein